MTRADAGGGRIVLDPDDLRRVSTRMKGAALLLSQSGRALAGRDLPVMPAGLAAFVTEVICAVNAELQDLAIELIQDGEQLASRALWAELGGGDAIAWLIPGLRAYPASPLPPGPAGASSAVVTEEQILAGEKWAVDLLNAAHDTLQGLDQEADRLGSKADDVLGPRLVRFLEQYADEAPVKALGRFTGAAGYALDVVRHWDEGWKEATARAGISAGMGALGTGLCMLLTSPSGPFGIGACIAVGFGAGAAGDQVGDEVFED